LPIKCQKIQFEINFELNFYNEPQRKVKIPHFIQITKDAFQAAGFNGSPFDFFSDEQLANTEFGSFKEFYGTKALFFAQITSKGLVVPRDKFVEMEDYLLSHDASDSNHDSESEITAKVSGSIVHYGEI